MPATAPTFIIPSAVGSRITTLMGLRRIRDSSSCHDEATKSSGSSARTCLTWVRSREGKNAATLKWRSRAWSYEIGVKSSSARGQMIRKVLFLIGNRHFLIRKRPFGVDRCRYVVGVLVPQEPLVFLPQEIFK